MKGHDIIFDIDNKKVGFVESRCDGIKVNNNLTYIDGTVSNRAVSEYIPECSTDAQFYIAILIGVSIFSCLIITAMCFYLKYIKSRNYNTLNENSRRKN